MTCCQVNDGYFVHFFSPSELKPLKKHAIFVLDVSGSMDGRKIEQLREAMAAILDDLNEGDYFNLIAFSSEVKVKRSLCAVGRLKHLFVTNRNRSEDNHVFVCFPGLEPRPA